MTGSNCFFTITFLLLPTLLNLLSSEKEIMVQETKKSFISSSLALSQKIVNFIYLCTTIVICISLFGYLS